MTKSLFNDDWQLEKFASKMVEGWMFNYYAEHTPVDDVREAFKAWLETFNHALNVAAEDYAKRVEDVARFLQQNEKKRRKRK